MSLVGERVGRLRILGLLGRGGMGEVWAAWDEQLERRVAVKTLQARRWTGGDTRRRFLQEARLLSQLDHPNVCRLFDLVEEEGRDYLVLELVDGRNLSTAAAGLDEAARLRVAREIAAALAAAHAKGIIHRDLKPGNVMLTSDGRVKVLDFGLARVAELGIEQVPPAPFVEKRDLQNRAADDETGPAASRAEQHLADPTTDSVDEPATLTVSMHVAPSSRSQTAAGSVVGTPAFMSPEQARGEPLTPASDLYSLGLLLHVLFSETTPYGNELSSDELLARARRAAVRPVVGVRGDLARLIRELESPRPADRPTAAEAVTRLERIRGRGRRRLRNLAVATGLLLILGAATKYVVDLDRERQAALAAQRESEQVLDFFIEVFSGLDPGSMPLREIPAAELLSGGVDHALERLPESPEARVRLLTRLGWTYFELGLLEDAERLVEAAQGVELAGDAPFDVLDDRDELLANLREEQGRYEEAAEVGRRRIQRRLADGVSPTAAWNDLGNALIRLERLDEAEQAYEQALTTARDDEDRFFAIKGLADVHDLGEDYQRSRPLYRQAMELALREFGEHHRLTASIVESWAVHLNYSGELEAAEEATRRALAINERVYGPESAQVAFTLTNLANIVAIQDRDREALELAERAVRVHRATLGPRHPFTGWSLEVVGQAQEGLGELDGAERSWLEAISIWQEAHGPDHPHLALPTRWLGRLYRRQGRWENARQQLERSLAISVASHGEGSFRNVKSLRELAELLFEIEAIEEARTVHERLLVAFAGAPDPDAAELVEDRQEYAELLRSRGRDREVEELKRLASGEDPTGEAQEAAP